jgi:hypothetical protein
MDDKSSPAICCEGVVAVGSGVSSDQVVVAFRNVSGRPIVAFRARYETLSGGGPLGSIDFVCDGRTVRKLESGDAVPFVFETGELAFVSHVRFRGNRLPDRFFVSSARQIQTAISTGELLRGRSPYRCGVFEVEFET